MCKQAELDHADMDLMTIGGCIDYIDTFIDLKNPNREVIRQASQKDMDQFWLTKGWGDVEKN